MRIDLKDPRVSEAVKEVQETHKVPFGRAFEKIFEEQYHCKIITDPNDVFCTSGSLHISEEKYANWFVLKFGAGKNGH